MVFLYLLIHTDLQGGGKRVVLDFEIGRIICVCEREIGKKKKRERIST